MWIKYNIILLLAVYVNCQESAVTLSRTARNIIYPEGSFIQFIFGFGLPISVYDQSLTLGTVLKFIYNMPTNGSVFTDSIPVIQDRSLPTRRDLYSRLESVSGRLGLDGRACVLRAICEAADVTFKYNGLLGEILHVLLSPSTTEEAARSPADTDYFAAERLGKEVPGCCHLLYPECKTGLLDSVSRIDSDEFDMY